MGEFLKQGGREELKFDAAEQKKPDREAELHVRPAAGPKTRCL